MSETFSLNLDWDAIRKGTKFSLKKDKQGHAILCGDFKIKDSKGKTRKFSSCVDLTDLVQNVRFHASNIVEYVESNIPNTMSSGPLHLTIEHSGGWLSETYHKVTKTANKIAQNRIVQDIYEDVLPEVAEYVPGGTTALNIAHKAHDLVVKAKEGYPDAKDKVANLIDAAKSGTHGVSDAASQVVKMMRGMAKLIDMKQDYEAQRVGAYELIGDGYQDNRASSLAARRASGTKGITPYNTGSRTPPTRRQTTSRQGSTVQPGTRDHRLQAPPPPVQYENQWEDPYLDMYGGNDPYRQVDAYGMTPFQPYNQDPYGYMGYQDPWEVANMLLQQQNQAQSQAEKDAAAAYAESLFDPTSPNYVRPTEENEAPLDYIQGWLKNVPYRDPLTALSQTTKDPGFVHRYLYNRGMGRG